MKKHAVIPAISIKDEAGRHLPAIIIPSGENPLFSLPRATVVKNAGVHEFITLVQGASLVITDSYHGTALSIALERQFINLKRFKDNEVSSQNIRLKDLLDRLGIASRTIQEQVTKITGKDLLPIDYDAVRPQLEQLRAESNLYLDKALSDAD